MRVIGGAARGRPLRVPKGATLRPTADRVREAIFDVLGHLDVLEEAVVLDLFAGSGALGIEALSRGAARVTFVERERRHADSISANLVATGLSGLPHRVVVNEVFRYLASAPAPCSLCFADPPYDFSDWASLLEVIPGDLVVLESSSPIPLDTGHELHRVYRYGGTLVTVARRNARRAGGSAPVGGGAPA